MVSAYLGPPKLSSCSSCNYDHYAVYCAYHNCIDDVIVVILQCLDSLMQEQKTRKPIITMSYIHL